MDAVARPEVGSGSPMGYWAAYGPSLLAFVVGATLSALFVVLRDRQSKRSQGYEQLG